MSPENTVIRTLQKADIPGAMRLKNAENWNQTEEDWKMLLEHDPDLCLAASRNDKVLGTVTATNYENEIAWIGMMLVDREFRGLGLSKRLLGALIEKLPDCRSIKLDATDKGLPVYKKLGFEAECVIDRMTTPKLEGTLPDERSNAVRPLLKVDLPGAVKLDHEAFGADRSQLFAEFLKRNGDKVWCTEREGTLSGYVLGRPGTMYTQLGPLSAETTEDAEMLLSAALSNSAGKPVALDILQDRKYLTEYLLSLGFSVQRSFTRMHLKNSAIPLSPHKYFLIAGPELG